MKRIWLCLAWMLGTTVQAAPPATPFAFGVLNHRSLQATAAYWNPILKYVTARSGVPLELHIGRTANETTDRVAAGKLDFAYTNHLFTPKRDQLGWRVLARQNSSGIRGQVVVLSHSPVKTLQDLAGKPVAFANPYGFTGYYVPMDALLRAGVRVVPVFAGNQEAAMGQLMAEEVAAAGVNHQVMTDFAQRRGLSYRVLSESEPYFDLAIMASPRVSAVDGDKVRKAFIGMEHDPEGLRVLQIAAHSLGLPEVRGFAPADNGDYKNYRAFLKRTLVPLNE
ncbi:MAG: phosphate/phosphite/phosphonate ABC transporter substrate-binding protein [Thiobacillus sp.]|nr:phosphate/phosphite/phosphonate ABC transporter substrate-binding protein [Gammaproteobacteria bacterium]MBU4498980.1 phosphate/phosphite/phosphonate ABC transporter substrate-binding protein [Gammaproteobacteria bacterium]MDO9007614.1 phosphate/phosphite/phosphonate ABC transporter substrate-binding protein [Thiobacillus sp.]MDP1923540.1 phosphate/phosphite/phosphonate ABC transporter substrate-binding protein [Thiobacillus sp.]MDP3124483.1 phosphate/phosphite/phosphonate ABC transporter su